MLVSEIIRQPNISKSSKNMKEIEDFMAKELPNILKKDLEVHVGNPTSDL